MDTWRHHDLSPAKRAAKGIVEFSNALCTHPRLLNDASENERTHNFVLAALLAVARALIRLRFCRAPALHANRRTHAVAIDASKRLSIFSNPSASQSSSSRTAFNVRWTLWTVDIFSSSLPASEPFGCRIARRRKLVNSVASSGLPPSRCRTPSGGLPANKDQRLARFSPGEALSRGEILPNWQISK